MARSAARSVVRSIREVAPSTQRQVTAGVYYDTPDRRGPSGPRACEGCGHIRTPLAPPTHVQRCTFRRRSAADVCPRNYLVALLTTGIRLGASHPTDKASREDRR